MTRRIESNSDTETQANNDQPQPMIGIEAVLRLVPISRTTLWALERQGRFPKGFYISNNRKLWLVSEIRDWQRALPRTAEGYVRPSRAGKRQA